MAIGIKVSDLIDLIGHDGSKIQWPHFDDPKCRKSFHLAECVHVAHKLGFKPVHFEFYPTAGIDQMNCYRLDFENQVKEIMQGQTGVLYGFGRRVPHACAWNGQRVYCPSTGHFLLDAPSSHFNPIAFILI